MLLSKSTRKVENMANGKNKSGKTPKPTRYQRNLQIAVIIVSILLVLSLILSAINI